jgi:exodeoxyribonuclease V
MKKEDIILTPSQKELKAKMKAFLNGPDRAFKISGKPGVGKTTMVKIVLADLLKADIEAGPAAGFDINVAGICLAHQAKNVLGEHIPNVFTFAKAYGLKEDIDEVTGERTFVYDKFADAVIIGERNIPVFVHDEVSQYTEEMLKIVYERTPIFSKMIFIGDRAQLPPIDPENKMGKDADSPIFNPDFYDFPDECQHELTERVRQAEGNPILELSDIIREEIFGLQRLDVVKEAIDKCIMKDGIGYDYVPAREFLLHLEGRDMHSTRIIAFRNTAINRYNPMVRNHLMNSPVNILAEGDMIAMRDTYFKEDEYGYPLFKLFNSEILELTRISTSNIRVSVGGNNYVIESYVANIKNRHGQFIIPTETGQPIFERALQETADLCTSRALPWDDFWKLKKEFCKWSYGYATTAYKSQGSTYETVYVDYDDIILTRPLTRKRKLQTIYTAITRAKKDVYFIKY